MTLEKGKDENVQTIIADPKKELPKIMEAKKSLETKMEVEKPKPKIKEVKEDEYSAEEADEIPTLKGSNDKRKS